MIISQGPTGILGIRMGAAATARPDEQGDSVKSISAGGPH
jgi:hypothetical protein